MGKRLELRFVRVDNLASDARTSEFRLYHLNGENIDDKILRTPESVGTFLGTIHSIYRAPTKPKYDGVTLYRSMDDQVRDDSGRPIKPHVSASGNSVMVFGASSVEDDLIIIQRACLAEMKLH